MIYEQNIFEAAEKIRNHPNIRLHGAAEAIVCEALEQATKHAYKQGFYDAKGKIIKALTAKSIT